MNQHVTTILRAAAVRDAAGVNHRPGCVAVRDGRIVQIGPGRDPPRNVGSHQQMLDLPQTLILPALVNAHAHLDLTLIGPTPYDGDFVPWLRGLMGRRPRRDRDITESVRQGLAASRAAGVGALGDIAGSLTAIAARRVAGGLPGHVPGVSYLECFGIGRPQAQSADDLARQLAMVPFESKVAEHERGVVVGIQPHAPYSAGARLYEAATRLSQRHAYRLCTHLAESAAETQFVRDAAGPLADLLRQLGKWDQTIRPTGKRPVEWFEPHLRHARWLLVHCNEVTDQEIQTLKRCGASVAYCPIAGEYFGFPQTGVHRYREMLAAGVNVCLGTDSILCQNPDEPQPLGILPQMRRLYRRDGTDPGLLLKMATVNGMLALEMNELDATLRPGTPADLIGVRIDTDDRTDPLTQALQNDYPVEPIDLAELA